MKTTLHTETVRTTERCQLLDVTSRVAQALGAAGVRNGMAIIYIPHTTAAVTINENADPDVQHDLIKKLAELVPHHESYYRHGEGNSDSHVKTALVGNSVTILIEDSELVLGQWQGIFFCEFDGPRQRQMQVKFVNFAP